MSLPARASLSRVMVALLSVLVVPLWCAVQPVSAVTGPSAGSVHRAADYGTMPLLFIPNQGQFDSRVAYTVQGRDTSIFFSTGGVTFVLSEQPTASGHKARSLRQVGTPEPAAQPPRQRWALKVDFVDANPVAKPETLEQAETLISYFKGRPEEWRTGLQAGRKIIYRDLWPGIDLVYSGTVDRLKYDFIVHPGADPDRIRLAWRGADSVQVTEDGQLAVTTPLGTLRDNMPVAWQEGEERQKKVSVAYDLRGPAGVQVAALATDRTLAAVQAHERVQVVGFTVGDYDRTRTLVLDPEMLVYCGFIGGSGADQGAAVAVDSRGNAYVTGNTFSNQDSFPVNDGPYTNYKGNGDAFVVKVKADGTGLDYCGFIGGDAGDYGYGIAVDKDFHAYVTGTTFSTGASFPTTGDLNPSHQGGSDAFIAKVNAPGTGLVYCGFIGGVGNDEGRGVALDSSGKAYVTGFTGSAKASFPPAFGPIILNDSGGVKDAFVARVNVGGTGLDYFRFIGGTGDDEGRGIAFDSKGDAYCVTGFSTTNDGTFPVSDGSFNTTHKGGSDAFVTKVKSDGTDLPYCGFIGGTGNDEGRGIAVDSSGNAYVTGVTDSVKASFPVAFGPIILNDNGGVKDAFVAKVKVGGAGLDYFRFIGGTGDDEGEGVAVDSSGNSYIAGSTLSNQLSFPVAIGPDLTFNGAWDAFVAKVKAGGKEFAFCGYLGGKGTDIALGIALDSSDSAYVTGYTVSTQMTSFPVTVGPDQFANGDVDAFIAKIREDDFPWPAFLPAIMEGAKEK